MNSRGCRLPSACDDVRAARSASVTASGAGRASPEIAIRYIGASCTGAAAVACRTGRSVGAGVQREEVQQRVVDAIGLLYRHRVRGLGDDGELGVADGPVEHSGMFKGDDVVITY